MWGVFKSVTLQLQILYVLRCAAFSYSTADAAAAFQPNITQSICVQSVRYNSDVCMLAAVSASEKTKARVVPNGVFEGAGVDIRDRVVTI